MPGRTRSLNPSFALIAPLAVAALLASGCTYVENRAKDFADQFSFGVGVGAGASMRATNYVQAGLLGSAASFKIKGRTIMQPMGPSGEASVFAAPVFHYRTVQTSDFTSTSRLHMLGCTLLPAHESRHWYRWADMSVWDIFPSRAAFEQDYDRRLFDIGGSLYLGLGVDFDFNIWEFADFWLGLFLIDISGDDRADTAPSAPQQASESGNDA